MLDHLKFHAIDRSIRFPVPGLLIRSAAVAVGAAGESLGWGIDSPPSELVLASLAHIIYEVSRSTDLL